MNYIQEVSRETSADDTIAQIIISRHYITSTATLGRVVETLTKDKSIEALCVVEKDMKVLGYIERNELLNIVGQKFGRELFQNHRVMDFIKEGRNIYFRRNIYSVIDEIEGVLQDKEKIYFILTDEEQRYKGLVSTEEIIRYLSQMMTDDLNRARKVQKVILKENRDVNNEFISFTGSAKMAGGIGGDFYTFTRITDNEWIAALCDVSGKGTKAALLSVALSGMFSAFDFTNGIVPFIKALNTFIYDLFHGEMFITGVFILINEKTGKCTIYDMGHSLAYIIKNRRAVRLKTSRENFPLGITETSKPVPSQLILNKGEIIFSITDGFIEQTNGSRKQLGEKKFISMLLEDNITDIVEMKNSLYKKIAHYKTGQSQSDDMTIFLLEKK